MTCRMAEWLLPVGLLLGGGAVLLLGAEWLVRGAVRVSLAVGISPLVVGLTIVAAGTSAPELAVSVQSAMHGRSDIAVGNVVGSNTFNLLIALGLPALLVPLRVAGQAVRFDLPFMAGAALLAWVLAADGSVTRLDGFLLVTMLVVHLGFTVWLGRRTGEAVDPGNLPGAPPRGAARARRGVAPALLLVAGLALVLGGSYVTVEGATSLAQVLGVSELVIGLTVVAIGTSLPELITSLAAIRHNAADLAVGNVTGSCIFNMFGILGAAAVAAPAGVDVALGVRTFDLPVMLTVTLVTMLLLVTDRVLERWEGALLVLYYIVYMVQLGFDAVDHPRQELWALAVRFYVLPLGLVVLSVLLHRVWKSRARPA
jgi:cation:H+ antiporter